MPSASQVTWSWGWWRSGIEHLPSPPRGLELDSRWSRTSGRTADDLFIQASLRQGDARSECSDRQYQWSHGTHNWGASWELRQVQTKRNGRHHCCSECLMGIPIDQELAVMFRWTSRQIGVLWIHLFAFTFSLWCDKLFKWMDRIVLGKMDSSKDNNLWCIQMMNFHSRDHSAWANQYHRTYLNFCDGRLNVYHDRSRGRHPQNFQSTLISIAFYPNLKVGDNRFQSKHNSNIVFEPGRLSYYLSYTEFRVLTSLESIKSVITCILFLRAINLPTEYSLPQQDRGFYLLDHSITLLAVNRKLACSFYSSAVSTTGFVVGPYLLSKRTLEQFGGRA